MPAVWNLEGDRALADELFRWRYLMRPDASGDTWIAHDGDRCVGVIDAYLRPDLLDGQRVYLRETADWFCLPQYRPLGLGLRMMRTVMRLPEAGITIGGTKATHALLPRLGWAEISSVEKMILPVNLRGLTSNVLRRHPEWGKYARAIPRFLPLRGPRAKPSPAADAQVAEWSPGQEIEIPIPHQDGLHELIEQSDLEWICAGPPRLFSTVVLVFRMAGKAVGFSLSQLEPSAGGPDGRIVHVQLAEPSPAVAEWVIAETARRLAERGAGFIRCRASTPLMIAAFRGVGFIAAGAEPVFWWGNGRSEPRDGIAVSYLRADDAVPFEAART